MLTDLLHKRRAYAERDGERFMDAVQNARLIANAERYYRIMYYGSRASWNLRDSHMFETLKTLARLSTVRKAKAVVWAHNSHIGDAAATEMFSRGEYNLGHLCRKEFGNRVYAVGFGTDSGTVAAASNWDGPMEIKTVLPSIAGELRAMSATNPGGPFCLDLRQSLDQRRGGLAKAAARARNRRDLSAGDGTRQPLFPGHPAGTVRRVHLV